jgi:hypothetical protein
MNRAMCDDDGRPVPYTCVETPDGQEVSVKHTVGDCFTDRELTLSRICDDAEMWVFAPGTWTGYTTYDRFHHVLYSVHLAPVPIRVVTLPETRTV